MPILSIIVPVYNAEEYLANCIQSIINQTFQDWELILVDDGSTDHSGEMCERYAAKDSRIIVKHQKNLGQSVARNIGLDIATGAYITFVDCDDEIEKNTYQDNIAILESNSNIEMLCYPIIYDYNTDKKRKEAFPDQLISNKRDIFLAWYNHRPIDKSSCTKIFNHKVIVNHKYPEGHLHEDFFFLLNLIPELNNIFISSKGEYHYYSREHSTLHTPSLQKDKDWVDAELEMIHQMYHFPELKQEFLPRFMDAARYLLNSTLKFPKADLSEQLQNLKNNLPPLRYVLCNSNVKNLFWYLYIRFWGIRIFYSTYKKILIFNKRNS